MSRRRYSFRKLRIGQKAPKCHSFSCPKASLALPASYCRLQNFHPPTDLWVESGYERFCKRHQSLLRHMLRSWFPLRATGSCTRLLPVSITLIFFLPPSDISGFWSSIFQAMATELFLLVFLAITWLSLLQLWVLWQHLFLESTPTFFRRDVT